ncbi:MAG: acyl-CoA dehydrogenase family protein [Actinomycetota bacterium]
MSFDDRLQPVLEIAAEHAAAVDREARFPEETISALRAAGLLGLTLPKAIGGLGGVPADFLSATRALASRCASSAMVYLMHVCAAQCALAGTAGGDSASLRSMAGGADLSTLAFSERGSRSHFWAPMSRIAPGDGRITISAQKSFVTSAGRADSYVVSTRPAGTDSPIESSLYLVPSSAGGIRAGSPWDGLGLRGNASGPMTFDVDVEDAALLGEAGKGLDLMLGVVLPWFQLGQGAVSLGIAEAAMTATVAHVTGAKLEHLGQTLADLPTVRARIGRAQTEVDTVAGFLADVARRMAEGDPQVPILAAKASANEMAIRVTTAAMQACGGAAMSRAMPIERSFRDARAGSVMAPTTDVLYELTGRALAGMPLL